LDFYESLIKSYPQKTKWTTMIWNIEEVSNDVIQAFGFDMGGGERFTGDPVVVLGQRGGDAVGAYRSLVCARHGAPNRLAIDPTWSGTWYKSIFANLERW
jgi:hypothetical protein